MRPKGGPSNFTWVLFEMPMPACSMGTAGIRALIQLVTGRKCRLWAHTWTGWTVLMLFRELLSTMPILQIIMLLPPWLVISRVEASQAKCNLEARGGFLIKETELNGS